ncbi:hypothetical protein B0H13DRAFT_2266960 [Mycena leptocephala]|nr:hypothetical protein B0H13DRAFT_2266960 [Mycena leptocephala]
MSSLPSRMLATLSAKGWSLSRVSDGRWKWRDWGGKRDRRRHRGAFPERELLLLIGEEECELRRCGGAGEEVKEDEREGSRREARWDSDRGNDEKCREKERYVQQVLSGRGGRERGKRGGEIWMDEEDANVRGGKVILRRMKSGGIRGAMGEEGDVKRGEEAGWLHRRGKGRRRRSGIHAVSSHGTSPLYELENVGSSELKRYNERTTLRGDDDSARINSMEVQVGVVKGVRSKTVRD